MRTFACDNKKCCNDEDVTSGHQYHRLSELNTGSGVLQGDAIICDRIEDYGTPGYEPGIVIKNEKGFDGKDCLTIYSLSDYNARQKFKQEKESGHE